MVKYKLNIAHITSYTHGVAFGEHINRALCHVELRISEVGEKGTVTPSWPELGQSCNDCGHPHSDLDPVKNECGEDLTVSTNRLIVFDGGSYRIVQKLKEHFTGRPKLPCIAATTTVMRFLTTLLSRPLDISNMAEELSLVWRQYFLGANWTTDIILRTCMEESNQSLYLVRLRKFTVSSDQKPFGKCLEHCCLEICSENGSLVFSLHPCLKKEYYMKAEKSGVTYTDQLFSIQCTEGSVRKIVSLPPHSTGVRNYCQVAMIDLLRNMKEITKDAAVNSKGAEPIDKVIGVLCDMNVDFQSALYNLRGSKLTGVTFGEVVFHQSKSDPEEVMKKSWPGKLFES